jgi:hypothetical protein
MDILSQACQLSRLDLLAQNETEYLTRIAHLFGDATQSKIFKQILDQCYRDASAEQSGWLPPAAKDSLAALSGFPKSKEGHYEPLLAGGAMFEDQTVKRPFEFARAFYQDCFAKVRDRECGIAEFTKNVDGFFYSNVLPMSAVAVLGILSHLESVDILVGQRTTGKYAKDIGFMAGGILATGWLSMAAVPV